MVIWVINYFSNSVSTPLHSCSALLFYWLHSTYFMKHKPTTITLLLPLSIQLHTCVQLMQNSIPLFPENVLHHIINLGAPACIFAHKLFEVCEHNTSVLNIGRCQYFPHRHTVRFSLILCFKHCAIAPFTYYIFT